MVSFDPAPLDAQAVQVTACAAAVADTMAQLRQLGASMSWHSPAARSFADALGAVLGQAEVSRRLTLELADALRRHGQVASHRAQDLTHAAEAVGAVLVAVGRQL
jgi:hypothetical protein